MKNPGGFFITFSVARRMRALPGLPPMPDQTTELERIAEEHLAITRRLFLRAAGAGLAALSPGFAQGQGLDPALEKALAKLEYLTRDKDFGTVERGNPLPYTLPEPKLKEIGMTRECWKLEVVADTATGTKVESALSKEKGTALDWAGLMKLAEKRSVKFVKVIT